MHCTRLIKILFSLLPLVSSLEKFPCGTPAKMLLTTEAYLNHLGNEWYVTSESFPWQARLLVGRAFANIPISACGATLVGSYHKNGTDLVITAASCLFDTDGTAKFSKKEELAIFAGVDTLDQIETSTVHYAKRVIGYDLEDGNMPTDLLLIQLEHVVPYTTRTRPVCFPSYEHLLTFDDSCFVSGWKEVSNEHSSRLRMEIVDIVPNYECPLFHDPAKEICVKDIRFANAMEPGSPLVCPIDGRYVLAGVITNANSNGQLFANVWNYIGWLARKREMIKNDDQFSSMEHTNAQSDSAFMELENADSAKYMDTF